MARFGSQLISLFAVSIVSCAVFCTTASAGVWSLPDTEGRNSTAAGIDPRNGEPVLYSVKRNKLLKLSLTSGVTEELIVLATSPEEGSEFHLAVDREGKVIISFTAARAILQYDLLTRQVTKIIDPTLGVNIDGKLAESPVIWPAWIAVDSSNKIIVVDKVGDIHQVDRESNNDVKTIARGGSERGDRDGAATTQAEFWHLRGMALDRDDNVFFSDGNAIRKLDRKQGTVLTVAGSAFHEGSADGAAKSARFTKPAGLAFDHEGNLLIADTGNELIRKLNLKKQEVQVFASVELTRPRYGTYPIEHALVVIPHHWPLAGGTFVVTAQGIRFIGPGDYYELNLEWIVAETLSAAAEGNEGRRGWGLQKLIDLSKTQTQVGQIAQVMSESRRDPEKSFLGRLVTDLHPQLNNLLTYQAFNGLRARMAQKELSYKLLGTVFYGVKR